MAGRLRMDQLASIRYGDDLSLDLKIWGALVSLKCSFWVLNLKLVDLPGPPPPCWILNSNSCFPSIKRQPKSTEQNAEFIFLWFLSLWDLSPRVLSALAVLRALPTPRFFCCFYAASLVLNRKSTLHSRYSVAAGSRAPSMGPTSCLLQARSCLGGRGGHRVWL